MYSTYEMEVYAKERQARLTAEAQAYRQLKLARQAKSQPSTVATAARNAWNQISVVFSQLTSNSQPNGTQPCQNMTTVECAS